MGVHRAVKPPVRAAAQHSRSQRQAGGVKENRFVGAEERTGHPPRPPTLHTPPPPPFLSTPSPAHPAYPPFLSTPSPPHLVLQRHGAQVRLLQHRRADVLKQGGRLGGGWRAAAAALPRHSPPRCCRRRHRSSRRSSRRSWRRCGGADGQPPHALLQVVPEDYELRGAVADAAGVAGKHCVGHGGQQVGGEGSGQPRPRQTGPWAQVAWAGD